MSPLFCFLALFLAVQNIDAERPTEVRVITNQLFHNQLNHMHIKVFRNMLDEYLGTKGINFAKEEIQERIVDERGMFAVRYILRGFECNELVELARDGKSRTDFVSAVKIKCPCKAEIVIDSTNVNQYRNTNQYQNANQYQDMNQYQTANQNQDMNQYQIANQNQDMNQYQNNNPYQNINPY